MVEGAKSVLELLTSDFQVVRVLGTAEFLSSLSTPTKTTVEEVTELELSGIGEFQTNTTALAIARMKPNSSLTISSNEFGLVLDDIRDPGNLGTIIRTADWYGIYKIIASSETADFYNPKVISASMGSFTRVQVFYTDLAEYLSRSPQNIFGAYLNGKNIREVTFGTEGLLIIGNESRGISADLEKFVTNKITIPRYGEAESLNAAIATAVICDNLRRSH
jgi:TrmH family RNA methyltransferase